MKLGYFAYLALVGGLAFLILFIADRDKKLGEERLSIYRIPHSELYADPDLKAGEHSPVRFPQTGLFFGLTGAEQFTPAFFERYFYAHWETQILAPR
jgi:hypothetical protein